MIDSTSETLISLADAAKAVPRRRRGRKTHLSTLYRWATVGVRGVVLETLQCGGSRVTSREAMQRFFEALSQPRAVGGQSGPIPVPRTVAQRRRASAASGRRLIEQGA
jgi:Protein of unknown function (DUF1580)